MIRGLIIYVYSSSDSLDIFLIVISTLLIVVGLWSIWILKAYKCIKIMSVRRFLGVSNNANSKYLPTFAVIMR